MTIIDDKIRKEKLQYNFNREAANMSVLSSGKIDKYEYLTVEKILPPDQRRVIEEAKFTCSPLGKASEKQTKAIEEQGKKQVEASKALTEEELESIEGIFSKNMRTDEIKNEKDEIKKWEDTIKQKDLKYEAGKYKYDFQQYEAIRCYGESIYSSKFSILKAGMDQTNLLENMKKKKMINLDQKQKKVRIKNEILLIV